MPRGRDLLMLVAGIMVALAGRTVWQRLCAATPTYALDLASVPSENRLWTAFQDFLKQEDQQLRVLPPPGGRKLALYQSQTHFFERFLVAGEGVRWQEERRLLTPAERIRRVIQTLERECATRQPDKGEALLADLRQVLAERAAALEVLRFSSPGYAKELVDPEIAVTWSVLWDPVGRRQYLQGSVEDLYRRRANELLAAAQAND